MTAEESMRDVPKGLMGNLTIRAGRGRGRGLWLGDHRKERRNSSGVS